MKSILTAFFLLSALPLCAQTMHLTNAQGYTLDAKGELIKFSEMTIEDGKITAVGEALVPETTSAEVIDLQQQVLLPGLIDAHGHLLGLGATLLQVDVRDFSSAQQSAQRVQEYAREHPDLAWITGRGWNQVLWPDKQFPTARQLDEYVKSRPVWLERIDGHAGWANSEALRIAGITKDTLDPPGGKILRYDNGEPTGVLIDNAMGLLETHLPKAGADFYAASLNAAGEHLLSLGVTSMHDAGISAEVLDFYQQRAKARTLPVRVYAMLAATEPKLVTLLKKGPVSDPSDFLSVRSVKAYGDGALGSRGAAMLQPYSDDPDNSGLLVTKQSALKSLFNTVIGAGWQLNFHAIGDRANRLALDQFADTFARVGGESLRHRIEHAQVVHPDDIPRFKTLGIIPSMQPTHATSDMNMAEDRVGKSRLAGAYAWQTFLKQGSPIAFGSDFPVELANPFYGLHAAVTRQSRDNQPRDGWIPDESVSIEQAFRGFTTDAAFAGHQEQQLGQLQPGFYADFIVIDQDIFTINPRNIWRTQVLQTWVAGQRVH